LEIFASSILEQKQVQVIYLDVQQQSENPEDSVHHSEKEYSIGLNLPVSGSVARNSDH
jgi:hypothetical protein